EDRDQEEQRFDREPENDRDEQDYDDEADHTHGASLTHLQRPTHNFASPERRRYLLRRRRRVKTRYLTLKVVLNDEFDPPHRSRRRTMPTAPGGDCSSGVSSTRRTHPSSKPWPRRCCRAMWRR